MKINLKLINESFGSNKQMFPAVLDYELDLENLYVVLNLFHRGLFESNNHQCMAEIIRLYLDGKEVGIYEQDVADFVCYVNHLSKPLLMEFLSRAKKGVVMNKQILVYQVRVRQSGQRKLG